LQIKAEDKVLSDVLGALRSVADIATQVQGSYKSLQLKQELTQLLIENERSRLRVWLFPLEPERKHHIPSLGGGKNSTDVGSSISDLLTYTDRQTLTRIP
jgi:phosphatidylinositol 4-kinase